MKIRNYLWAFVVTSLFLLLTGCTSSYYAWYNYDDTSYRYNKLEDETVRKELMTTYQKMIQKPSGSLRKVPPGVYADYGYLLLLDNQIEQGITMLKKEIELYPESEPFIKYILKTLEEKQ